MSKQHIGILTERMTLGYGVDLVIHEQAVRLIKMGYKVTVFPGWKTDLYDDQPYDVVALGEDEKPVHYYSLDFMHLAFEKMKARKIEVWIIQTPPFYFWLTHLPAPVIMVEHGTPPGKYFGGREGRFLDTQTRKRQRTLFRSTRTGDGLVAISEYIRSGLPKDVRKATRVIHNGADHYPVSKKDRALVFRRRFNLKASDIMILWVGRLQPRRDPQPYKGLADLLKLSPELKRENSKITIVAAGRGDESAASILETHGIKSWLNVPREDMPALYAAADIFVSTSFWEGFNLPLVEAQFQGTPVVALDLCAHTEVVSDGFSGFLVKDLKDMKARVLELATDKDKRSEMSCNAQSFVSKFTWDQNVAQLEVLIQDCLSVTGNKKSNDISLKKSAGYYMDYAQYLIGRFGWRVFFKECFGWIKRRI